MSWCCAGSCELHAILDFAKTCGMSTAGYCPFNQQSCLCLWLGVSIVSSTSLVDMRPRTTCMGPGINLQIMNLLVSATGGNGFAGLANFWAILVTSWLFSFKKGCWRTFSGPHNSLSWCQNAALKSFMFYFFLILVWNYINLIFFCVILKWNTQIDMIFIILAWNSKNFMILMILVWNTWVCMIL